MQQRRLFDLRTLGLPILRHAPAPPLKAAPLIPWPDVPGRSDARYGTIVANPAW
jgi:hypothetical protein